ELSSVSSSPASSPKAKMAVPSLQKSSQVGASQLLKRSVQRMEGAVMYKQAPGKAKPQGGGGAADGPPPGGLRRLPALVGRHPLRCSFLLQGDPRGSLGAEAR
ncbi:hypothetical protein E2320_006807, partial [Naja naja]